MPLQSQSSKPACTPAARRFLRRSDSAHCGIRDTVFHARPGRTRLVAALEFWRLLTSVPFPLWPGCNRLVLWSGLALFVSQDFRREQKQLAFIQPFRPRPIADPQKLLQYVLQLPDPALAGLPIFQNAYNHTLQGCWAARQVVEINSHHFLSSLEPARPFPIPTKDPRTR
jgi:hypothetical protein